MKRYATTLLALFCLVLTTGLVQAQDAVTVREIKSVSQENIDELQQLGASLTAEDIERLARSAYEGEKVTFTAVILAEPRNSGLASLNSEGQPGRLHFFVRDTAAVSQGVAGMDIQIVSGYPAWKDQGVVGFFKGDVVTITGEVQYFDEANMQIAPETIEYLGDYESLGLPASLLEPVSVTTADLNKNMGEAQIQFNWANYNDLNQQYVRIEDATVWRSPNRTDSRPNWAVTTDGAETVVQNDDISLCFRNDKRDYPDDFNECKNTEFEGPAPGAMVNVEGFVTIRGSFDPFNVGVPAEGVAKIVPWEEDDLVVTAQPAITNVAIAPLDEVPGNAPIPVSVEVTGDLSVVTDVTLTYTPGGGEATTITLDAQGDGTYTGEIPAQPDGTFLSYTADVTDNTGTTYSTPFPTATRVLYDGINAIADIQEVPAGGGGASVFRDATLPMALTVTVQSNPGVSGLLAVQDDAGLAPWSGILVEPTEALLTLQPGDVFEITAATVTENFDVTTLTDVQVGATIPSGEGDPYPYVELTTGALQDAAIAEAYEGMMVRFDDVEITNPDAGFGEWRFATVGEDGTLEAEVLADDASDALGSDFASTTFQEGDRIEFIRGIWWFSFGNYKLLPESADDVGSVVVGVEDEALPGTFALAQNYPNPFNPVTTIQYEIAAAGRVTLEVVDLLGRTVATLVDGDLGAGSHQVQFDGRDLASGLYVYRLTSGGQTIAKKMMLMK